MEVGSREVEAGFPQINVYLACSRIVQTDLKGLSRFGCVSNPLPVLPFNYNLIDRYRSSLSFLKCLFQRKLSIY